MKYLLLILGVVLFSITSATGQNSFNYFPPANFGVYQSTHNSYDYQSFFYQPETVAPVSLKSLGQSGAGLFHDAFSQLTVQPANMDAGDDEIHLFAEAGSMQQKPVNRQFINSYRTHRPAINITPPDYPYAQDRKELQPVLNLGLISDSNVLGVNGLRLGGAYRLTFTDENFHAEDNPFRSTAILSHHGTQFSSNTGEVVNFFDALGSGDFLEHRGHNAQFFGVWQWNRDWQIGWRMAGQVYNKTGVFGGEDVNHYDSFSNERIQDYRHADINLGIQHLFSEHRRAGVQVGWLTGRMEQNSATGSYIDWADTNRRFFTGENTIDEKGQTWYSGADFHTRLNNYLHWTASYTYHRQNRDGDLANSFNFQQNLFVRHEGVTDQFMQHSLSSLDQTGSFTGNRHTHRLYNNLRSVSGQRTTAAIGVNITWTRETIETREPYGFSSESELIDEATSQLELYEITDETGKVSLDYHQDHRRFELPSVFSAELFRYFQLWWGGTFVIDRVESESRYQVSYERSDYHSETENSGELTPQEVESERTDDQTDMIINTFVGLRASPFENLDLMILTTPLRLQPDYDLFALHQLRFSMQFRL